MSQRVFSLPALSLLTLLTGVLHAQAKLDSNSFGAIRARQIGPAVMGGRIAAVDAVNDDPQIIYVGAAGGGVWKSSDGGASFRPVFDKHTQSIGEIAIDQKNPETVWVGTGEPWVRNSTSVGTGLYKTTDGGKNWRRVGLEDSERIARIVIHPHDSKTVYVAALGHLWNANQQRGLFKTTDGGKTWEKILYVDADTGCADLAIDPQEPDILFASMWQFRRQPHTFKSGGPGSALYKSTDGGKNWKKLSQGLPEGELGRIAVAVAPTRPNRVYAVVEAKKENALYRSDDSGRTWERKTVSGGVQVRPFYFGRMLVHPRDYKRIYKASTILAVSVDGGETFGVAGGGFGGGVHPDIHDFWISPNDPKRQLLATDGGLYISLDGGGGWNSLQNLPVSQFYQVRYDMQYPYNVYGGLQDNGSWSGPSQSPAGIQNKDWRNLGVGDGFHVWPDPDDPNVIYWESQGGNVQRKNLVNNENQSIAPSPAQGEPDYRYNWNTPIYISPSKALYVGSQFLFRSRDRGLSWDRISDDLTTDDPEKQRQDLSGGLTTDNSTAENHCTIYTISESARDRNVVWAGTDDGNLQVTLNGGRTWKNVVSNVPGLPPHTWVSSVQAGRHESSVAYVTFDGHRTGDLKPHVYVTRDFGETFSSLSSDDLEGYAHVIRDDLVNPDLLFLGTEFGLYLSLDGGSQWARFTGNIPKVSVRDIAIHPREHDLILASHGRGILIVDDLTPLRQLSSEILAADAYLLDSRPSAIVPISLVQEFEAGNYVGPNRPEAAQITYYLRKRHIFGDLKVEIYSPEGKKLATLSGGKRRGVNRVSWQMRGAPPRVARAPTLGGLVVGPMSPEGEYRVKLIKGNRSYEGKIRLTAPPHSPHGAEDRRIRQEAVMELYGMQADLAFTAGSLSRIRDDAHERAGALAGNDDLEAELKELADELDSLHKTLVATRIGGITGEVQLREKVIGLYSAVNFYGGRPTRSQQARAQVLAAELREKEGAFKAIVQSRLQSVNRQLAEESLEPIAVPTRDDFDAERGGSASGLSAKQLRFFGARLAGSLSAMKYR